MTTHHIYISRDVVFEEGRPHRTLTSVGETKIPSFDADVETDTVHAPLTNHNARTDPAIISDNHGDANPDQIDVDQIDKQSAPVIPAEPR